MAEQHDPRGHAVHLFDQSRKEEHKSFDRHRNLRSQSFMNRRRGMQSVQPEILVDWDSAAGIIKIRSRQVERVIGLAIAGDIPKARCLWISLGVVEDVREEEVGIE